MEHRVPLDFDYLKTNLDEKCNHSGELTPETLMDLLDRRFDTIDWEGARLDLGSFVDDDKGLIRNKC